MIACGTTVRPGDRHAPGSRRAPQSGTVGARPLTLLRDRQGVACTRGIPGHATHPPALPREDANMSAVRTLTSNRDHIQYRIDSLDEEIENYEQAAQRAAEQQAELRTELEDINRAIDTLESLDI